ncbi:MAG: TadE/TadG family type IV pilus assembly protein [Methyloligellaceae bacterium]
MTDLHEPGISRRPRRKFSLLKRLRKDRSGVTAVEFAFVAGPFFALLFAIMEVGLVFFGTLTLENAAEESARLIRTGQAHDVSMGETGFKTEVCSRIFVLFDCQNGLKVEVKTFPDFADLAANGFGDPLTGDGDLRDDFSFDIGQGGQIMLVRVFYEWNLMVSFPGVGLSNMSNGNRLVSAVTSFRNEPFDS